MKRIFTLVLFLMSFSCFAVSEIATPTSCEKAPSTTSPTFCSKFKDIASCHCQVDGHLPPGLCTDVGTIYNRMIAFYGSQQKACIYAVTKGAPIRPDSLEECMQGWDCYRLGQGQCYARCM